MKKVGLLLCLLLTVGWGAAQELYPLAEPASVLPKHTLGLRMFSETYKEVNQWRNMTALRLMYGISPKFSVYLTGIASNHHGKKMPVEFPFHNTPERGAYYPYKFNGFHLYLKYRFFSLDGEKSHLRMALYGEGAYVKTTHHEAEPDLEMGDNKGLGAGFIATYLNRKVAVSATIGGIFPFSALGASPDNIDQLPDMPVRTYYGKALNYHLSLGYLFLPFQYKNYDQTNFNLYLEFHGKIMDNARVDLFVGKENEYRLDPVTYPAALQAGYFLDVSPGAQLILKSNTRLDFSVTFPVAGISYARLYPVYTIGLQHYFYLGRSKN